MTEETRKIRVSVVPRPPKTVEETGLSLGFLVELACKTLYFGGVMSLSSLSEQLALPVSVSNDVMEFLKKERLAEVKKGGDIRAAYTYALTDLGRERAREYLQLSGYFGAAPVTLAQYTEVTRKQTVRKMSVNRESMDRAFEGVILTPGLLERLGPAVNSGRSIFLYGPSGNGKTFIAERLAKVLSGNVFIPHAICVDNQVIRVFDPVNHSRVDLGTPMDPARAVLTERAEYDRRWVLCDRPVIVSGGELTLAMLDLSFDAIAKFYEAPLQLKANGGVFLIDDLGRQLVRPFDLLNRWIVPLEKARDYLGEEEYIGICRQVCERQGLSFRPEVIRFLLDEEHGKRGIRLSACHPSDVLSRVVEICQYEGVPPRLDNELVERACRDYFTEL